MGQVSVIDRHLQNVKVDPDTHQKFDVTGCPSLSDIANLSLIAGRLVTITLAPEHLWGHKKLSLSVRFRTLGEGRHHDKGQMDFCAHLYRITQASKIRVGVTLLGAVTGTLFLEGERYGRVYVPCYLVKQLATYRQGSMPAIAYQLPVR